MASVFAVQHSPSQLEGSQQMNTFTINASPEVDVVQARPLPGLMESYLADALRHGIAQSTHDNYVRQLRPFFEWLDEVGPDTDWNLTRDLLETFPLWLARKHSYSESTVETYCRRARGLLRWLYRSGRMHADISNWIPNRGRPLARTRLLTPPQIEAVWSHIAGGYRLRNMALFAFMLETGVRRIEAANVRWCDLKFVEGWRGYMYLPVVKGYLTTDKTRTVVFGEVSGKLLQLHRVLQAPSPDERVFRVTREGIRQVMEKLSAKSGVAFSAHDLRRTFSTHWIRHCRTNNPSLAEMLIDQQLGHTSRSITRRHYVVLDEADVLEHYTSPLDACRLRGLDSWTR